jgi:hypothetical protein
VDISEATILGGTISVAIISVATISVAIISEDTTSLDHSSFGKCAATKKGAPVASNGFDPGSC